MAAAVILKTGLILYLGRCGTYLHEILLRHKNYTPQAILTSKFNSNKLQDSDGRHFEILSNGHNSVIVEHVCTKFG